MSRKNNLNGLLLRAFLCLAGLILGFSIFASTAALQNTNTAVVPVNATNSTRKNPMPRPTGVNTTNKLSNSRVTNSPRTTNALPNSNYYEPEIMATPTPPANSTIRGRVFYADTGRAVKRASIMLMRGDGDDGPSSAPSAITDGDGNFQMKNVRAGTYYAMVNAPGIVAPLAYLDFSVMSGGGSEREALAKAFEDFEKIVVDGLTDVYVQVPARRGGAVGGRVMYEDGDAAIGVKVEILRKVKDKFIPVIPNLSTIFSMRMGGAFQTDDRGIYRFAGLPAGEYIVKVTENTTHNEIGEKNFGYDPFDGALGRSSLLTIFYPDSFEAKTARIINVELGQEITEINLTIPNRKLYKLEGKLIARKDRSPIKGRVTIKKEGNEDALSIFDELGRRNLTTFTDENGNWKFKELPTGNYKLIFEPFEGEDDYQRALGNYNNVNAVSNGEKIPSKLRLAKKIQEIRIEDQDLTEMTIELGYGATISGTAIVENSTEMPGNLLIKAVNEMDEAGASTNIVNFSANGEFPPKPQNTVHKFELENIIEGKNYLFFDFNGDNYYVKSATVGGTDLLAGMFEIKDGDIWRNARIVLAKDMGTVKGVATNEQKEPLQNARVSLIPTDPVKRKNPSFYRYGVTGENGEFMIKAAPGEYAVILFDEKIGSNNYTEVLKWLDEAVKDAQKVTVTAEQTETVTIRKK